MRCIYECQDIYICIKEKVAQGNGDLLQIKYVFFVVRGLMSIYLNLYIVIEVNVYIETFCYICFYIKNIHENLSRRVDIFFCYQGRKMCHDNKNAVKKIRLLEGIQLNNIH